MTLNWFILYLNDPRKVKYINSTLYSAGIKGSLWIPTQGGMTTGDVPHKPLFSGYVFIGVDPKHGDIEGALRESTLGAFLKHPGSDHSATLTDDEIEHIRILEVECAEALAEDTGPIFAVGQDVEIRQGPFAGTPAKVLDVRKGKVRVEMCVFQRHVTALLDVTACRKVDA